MRFHLSCIMPASAQPFAGFTCLWISIIFTVLFGTFFIRWKVNVIRLLGRMQVLLWIAMMAIPTCGFFEKKDQTHLRFDGRRLMRISH